MLGDVTTGAANDQSKSPRWPGAWSPGIAGRAGPLQYGKARANLPRANFQKSGTTRRSRADDRPRGRRIVDELSGPEILTVDCLKAGRRLRPRRRGPRWPRCPTGGDGRAEAPEPAAPALFPAAPMADTPRLHRNKPAKAREASSARSWKLTCVASGADRLVSGETEARIAAIGGLGRLLAGYTCTSSMRPVKPLSES